MTLAPRSNPFLRVALALALILATTCSLVAQDAPASDDAPAPEDTADASSERTAEPRSGYEVRNELGTLLRESPDELGSVLALDPTLLSSDTYLADYPALARFVAAHPEVRRNPGFYLEEFEPSSGLDGNFVEGIFIFSMFATFAFVLVALVRTIVEHRRWSRLSRIQSDVHNKILERFGTSEALLEYMRSPAGAKFLESAPIPLQAERPLQNVPIARVLWSIQLGLIVAAGALGMLLVSTRYEADEARGFFSLGVIALCIGGGFVVSAIVSLVMSRRLGLWQGPEAPRGADVEDPGFGR